MPAAVVIPIPIRSAVEGWRSVYPDVLFQTERRAEYAQAYAGPVFQAPVFPPVGELPASLPRLDAPAYFAPTTTPATPAAVKPVAAVYPDALERPAPLQQWYTRPERQPFPDGRAGAVYPDRVVALTVDPSEQRAFFAPDRQPFPVPFAALFPAEVRGPEREVLRWFTEPERQPVPTFFKALFPDWLERPAVPASVQRAWFGPDRQPEPRDEIWTPDYPAEVRGPAPNVWQWYATADRQPVPTFYKAVYPDRIDRPTVEASEQRAFFGAERQPFPVPFSAIYPTTVPGPLPNPLSYFVEPERQPVPTFYKAVYPNIVRGLAVDVSEQRAFFGVDRQPFPGGHASAVYPDRIDRFVVTADEQRAWFGPDRQPFPVPFLALFADRVVGPAVDVSEQKAWFGPERQPFPNGRAGAVYPDRIDRPVVTSDEQRAVFEPDRQPEPRMEDWTPGYPAEVRGPLPNVWQWFTTADRQPLPTAFLALFPERIDRPFVDASEQRAFFGADRQPFPGGHASAEYPNRIDRFVVTPDEQKAWFGPDRQPEPRNELWTPDYPAEARGPAPNTWQWFTTAERQPVPTFHDALYPSWLERPAVPPAEQRAWFGVDRQPFPDGRAGATYPDAIDRLVVTADEQRAFFGPDRQPEPRDELWTVDCPAEVRGPERETLRWFAAPERQPTPTFFEAAFPDWLERPALDVSEQRAFFAPDRQPEPQLEVWTPGFPAEVRGPERETLSWFATANRQPEPVFFEAAYPDRIDRPVVDVFEQRPWFEPEEQPFPPGKAGAVYPDEVRSPVVTADEQQAFFAPTRQPEPVFFESVYPDLLLGVPGPEHQRWLAFADNRGSFVPTFFEAVYPDLLLPAPRETERWFGAPILPPPVPFWMVSQPDWLVRPDMPVQTAYFAPEQTPPAAFAGWVPFDIAQPIFTYRYQHDAYFAPVLAPARRVFPRNEGGGWDVEDVEYQARPGLRQLFEDARASRVARIKAAAGRVSVTGLDNAVVRRTKARTAGAPQPPPELPAQPEPQLPATPARQPSNGAVIFVLGVALALLLVLWSDEDDER